MCRSVLLALFILLNLYFTKFGVWNYKHLPLSEWLLNLILNVFLIFVIVRDFSMLGYFFGIGPVHLIHNVWDGCSLLRSQGCVWLPSIWNIGQTRGIFRNPISLVCRILDTASPCVGSPPPTAPACWGDLWLSWAVCWVLKALQENHQPRTPPVTCSIHQVPLCCVLTPHGSCLH